MEDVKGRALFEAGNNSPYAAFFQLPYPIFYLTIKGFYGKAVRYPLMLQTFSSSFDSSSGNFKIDLKLFGYKYTVAHWFRLDKGFSLPKVDDWFKLKEILEFDETYDILMNQYILVPDRQEQIAKLGLKSVEILPKHRYIYFTDNKEYYMKKLKYKILPYPKGDNKRYDSSYQPTTQTKLL